jgi:hypothetical protein
MRRIWPQRSRFLPPLWPQVQRWNAPMPPNPMPLLDAFITISIFATLLMLSMALFWCVVNRQAKIPLSMEWDAVGVVNVDAMGLLAAWLALIGLVWLLWPVKWRCFGPAQWRPVAHRTLHRYRSALGYWILLSTMFFIVLSAISWPLRRQAEQQWEALMQRGEWATAQQALSAKH